MDIIQIYQTCYETGAYNCNVKMPFVAPHCNCTGVHKFHGLKTTSAIRNGSGLDKPTLIQQEGLCKFCEHEVLWKKETWDGRSKRGNKSTKTKDTV